jgi:hypothetical protein
VFGGGELCSFLGFILTFLGNLNIETDLRRLKTAEIKFMRRTAEYLLLDHRMDGDILEEIKVERVKKEISTI